MSADNTASPASSVIAWPSRWWSGRWLPDVRLVEVRCFALAAAWMLSWGATAAPIPAVGLDPDKAITQLVHDVWGTREGLPDRRVTAIAQTPDGYLWVGTAGGLARFDGVRFTVFRSSSHPGIGSDDIRALLVDQSGALWIGTYGGGLTRLQDGRFTRYTTDDGLAHDIVYRISQVRSGALWIGTGGGVSRLEDGVFTTYTTEQGLAGDRVFSVIEDLEGTIWIATYGGGLSRYRDGKFTTFGVDDGLGSNLILDLHEDADGVIWISSYGGGLARLRNGRFSRFTAENGPGHDRVFDLLRDSSGSLWAGTYGGGLSRLHDGRFTNYSKEDGLTDDLVIALLQDREGSLWVGTGNGLERFRNGKVTHYSTAEGLSHDRVYSVYEDPAGTLWIATEGGGLNRFRDGRFTAYTPADGLVSNNVVSLAGDHEGGLWIGSVGNGVSLRQDDRFISYGADEGFRGVVTAIVDDAEGGVWIGTSEGLGRLHDGRLTVVDTPDRSTSLIVRSLLLDRTGALWIGTNGSGLSRFDEGRFTNYTVADGLGGDFIYTLHEDGEGTLWIGAKDGGLTRFKDGRFFSFARPGGLTKAAVYQIVEDSGDLWLGHPSQLQRVDKQQLDAFADGRIDRIVTTVFDESDGIRGGFNGGSQPGGWRSADGRLWFAGDAGVVAVDPSAIPINQLPPSVHIEVVLAGEQRIDLGAGTGSAGVELPPGNGNFEFQYTALSLVAPDQVQFKYRLKGFDTEWIDAGTRRSAFYTNVPPGLYQFQVIASNNDGVWNEQGDSFAFHLDPLYYQTWWFYLLCGVFLLLAVIAVHRLRVHHLRARANTLAATVQERTRELATANEMLRRISTLDSLTGIANRRSFDEKLEVEWRRAIRHDWPLSAVMIDIDDFKSFNDGHGHQKGDECLRQVADALRNGTARSGDWVARYGGEEFVVLLPDTDPAGAVAVAERLRREIASLAITHGFSSAGTIVTISAGVGTLFPGVDQSRDDIIKQADRRLYDAKRAGRNRVSGAVCVGSG